METITDPKVYELVYGKEMPRHRRFQARDRIAKEVKMLQEAGIHPTQTTINKLRRVSEPSWTYLSGAENGWLRKMVARRKGTADFASEVIKTGETWREYYSKLDSNVVSYGAWVDNERDVYASYPACAVCFEKCCVDKVIKDRKMPKSWTGDWWFNGDS